MGQVGGALASHITGFGSPGKLDSSAAASVPWSAAPTSNSATPRPPASPSSLNAQVPTWRRRTTAQPVSPPEAPLPWPRPIIEYIQRVTGLIEGRPVSRTEILEMLARAVRQHRMVRERRIDQRVGQLHGKPP